MKTFFDLALCIVLILWIISALVATLAPLGLDLLTWRKFSLKTRMFAGKWLKISAFAFLVIIMVPSAIVLFGLTLRGFQGVGAYLIMLGFYGFWSLYLHSKGAKTLARCEEEAHEQRLRDLNDEP
jgi:predicted membrane protein